MDQTLNKIVRSNGHNHYVIETEDRDEFLAAGFVVCGTVSEDCKIRFVVRQKGNHEVRTDNNVLYRSEGQDNLNSGNADPTGATVGQVEVNDSPSSRDAGGSRQESVSTLTGDADSGV